MATAARASAFGLTAFVIAACGLDVVGVDPIVEAGAGGSNEAGCDAGCSTAPTEWTAASLSTGEGGSCPAGATAQTVFESPSAGACTCECGAPKVNPCTQGSKLTYKIGGQNTTSCGGGDLTVNVTGGCDPLQASGAAIGSLSCNSGLCQYVGAPALTATAPQACDVTQKPAVSSASKSTLCTAAGASASCLVRAGDLACPTGFPQKHVVYAETAINDTRVCTGCACTTGTATCGAPTITLYSNATCTGTPVGSGAVNGTCVKIAESINAASHFKYTSAPSACSIATPPTVASGTFDPGPPISVCCR